MDLDTHILRAIQGRPGTSSAMTIGDLARQLGVNPAIVLAAAHRLVDEGLASPSTVSVRGVPTLRGISRLPTVPTA